MRITLCVLLSCISALLAADEHRPKKIDDRGKRNLEYSLSHHYAGPHSYRLERRISTGPQQHPLYHPQFFPGPRPYSSYRKDGHNEIGKSEDLLTDNNHLSESYYAGPQPQKHIVERPVYIKEPEPIIEIIIKESNVTLPAPPIPPPQKKKKEQVQVFYVKYKKNPNGHGKDSVIYDKPIPAISPPIPEDEEEQVEHQHYHEHVTLPPPPSTTLRTIIKPDSETYHSPSGIKVTFGKEGFDYDKRASKPEDYHRPADSRPTGSVQFPQGRQLQSFSSAYYKRAPITNPSYHTPNFRSEPRAPQSYRPFNLPPPPQFKPQNQQFSRPSPQFPPAPKYPFQSPPYTKPTGPTFPQHFPPQFQQTISHPPPVHFQANQQGDFHRNPPPPPPPSQVRQPVPYKPFENLKPQQQSFPAPPQQPHQSNIQFRPETHFPTQQQLPLNNHNHNFNGQLRFSQQAPSQKFRNPELLKHEVLLPQHNHHHIQQQPQHVIPQNQHHIQQPPQQIIPENQHHIQQQPQQIIPQNQQFSQRLPQNEHLNNLQHAQNFLPPGGELIQSLPKFEQHISIIEPNRQQPQQLPLQTEQNQFLSAEEYSRKIQQQFAHGDLGKIEQQVPKEQQIQQEASQQLVSQNHLLQQQQNRHQQHQQETREQQPQTHQQQQQQLLQQQFYEQLQQQHEQQQQRFSSTRQPSFVYQTTRKPVITSTTTAKPTTTTETPEKPSTTTKDPKLLNAQLPDEVPDDLRAQLLSSGILNNADISVLDYDKVGDIPLSALPPDQLANFYNAGGAQQLSTAGSEPVPSIVDINGKHIEEDESDQQPEGSENIEVKSDETVQMKVVHYDPQTDRGQQVQDAYVKDDAKQVEPVVLNDNTYNRYLPLKVNGTQFPIPDVPELKDKKISSVVVLAPVAYDFSAKRTSREAKGDVEDIELIQGDALKELLKDPTLDNYKRFLENENKTRSDKQSVILLVTGSKEDARKEKEIFMYDVATQTVSKLSGELSSAFVEAAEANSEDDDSPRPQVASASNKIETRVPYEGNLDRQASDDELDLELEQSPSDIVESKVPIIDPMDGDLETEASEQLESFVDISGLRVEAPHNDLTAAASDNIISARGGGA